MRADIGNPPALQHADFFCALDPFVDRLARWRVPRSLAAMLGE